MYLLIFLIVLSILIIVHEYGHFAVAKKLGIKVERFSLGFGPKLFGRTFGDTEFALCLIPLGGYVKMAGEERSRCTGAKNEFFSRSPGHRALVVIMGPLVNYIMGFLCFWLVFMIGYPTLSTTIGKVLEGYPAIEAGLKKGDRIIAIDGRSVASWEDLQRTVTQSEQGPLHITLRRGQRLLEKTITPARDELTNIFGQKEEVRLIGVQPTEEIIRLQYGPGQAFVKAGNRIYEITVLTYKALYRIATRTMSARESITGPIGIFYVIKEATDMGFAYVVYVMAIISVSLAIFNLLPLPILDGGHLLFMGIERLRGRPLSEKMDEAIGRVGLALIIALALFVFYSDFQRFGIIDKIANYFQNVGS